ncbi:DUF4303 domain-containing protein [Azospirillum sp. B4]|uniref:DUF4303 domain-containing protein n=1 Tax=Azospirillum sp. B4 TaxID=95605 RepID=UPI00034621A0|nr:DUF4303 domain-containing protein [Azospirillum sp. B4]
MDWTALKTRIVNATRKAVSDLRLAHGTDTVYAYALYTDSGAMTVVLSANSVQGFDAAVSSQGDRSPATLAYYKWATAEWAYEGWGGPEFKDICTDLRTSPDRRDFSKFKAALLDTMTGALKGNSEAIIDAGGLSPSRYNVTPLTFGGQ